MAAKPKYNAPYHDNWAWSLAAMGATNEEIALAMGVSERTIMRWAKEHESFGKALGEGKGVSDAKVIRSLYERATGYEYEEEKKIIEYDKDGNTYKPDGTRLWTDEMVHNAVDKGWITAAEFEEITGEKFETT